MRRPRRFRHVSLGSLRNGSLHITISFNESRDNYDRDDGSFACAHPADGKRDTRTRSCKEEIIMKKVISVVLSISLVLSVTLSAFAVEPAKDIEDLDKEIQSLLDERATVLSEFFR